MDISNKHIWHITYPIAMTLLSQNIINVTDTAFLGHIGEVELGASAIGGIFYIALFMIGFGFSQGCQILIGRRNGERKYLEIGKIFNNGLIFNLLLAFLFFVFSLFFMSFGLKEIIHSENIYQASIKYLDYRIYGIFFAFINVIFRSFFVGITQTRILSTSSIVTAIVNILLDYVLIFGKFGFPEMGIIGAAIASVLAEAVTTIYLILYTIKKTDIKRYGLLSFVNLDFKTIKATLKISIYIMLQFFISVSTWFMFFLFIERTGERPLAVSNIVRSFYTLLMIPAFAFGTTTSTMISNLIGEGRESEVIRFLKKLVYINMATTAPIIILISVFPQFFVQFFTSDLELIQATIPVMQVLSGSLFIFGTGIVLFSAVSATGNTKIAFLIEFFVLFFYIGYAYYTTVIEPCQVAVVWFAEYIYWLLIGILSFLYLKKGNWRRIKI